MKTDPEQRHDNAMHLHKQHGASLLEGIAYLGIAALVVLGAVSLLTGASASAKANQTKEELVALRTAVKKLYAGQAYPSANPTSLTGQLTAARAVPSTLQVSGNAITNSWGGAVTVDGTTPTTFTIVYNNVPQDVCVNALSGLTGWTSVRAAQGQPVVTFPMTTADATTICGNTDDNDVSFVSN